MNPFTYGEFVKKKNFLNREDEIASLTRDLIDGQKVFLISPRRFGKTSLLQIVIEKLNKKKVKTVYVDLFKCSSLEQFAANLTKELSKFETGSLEKTIKFIKEFISCLRPFISIKQNGEISIQLDAIPKKQEIYDIFEQLLEYPYEYSKKNNVDVVIMFDEFQEIIKFGGQEIEKFIRAVIQHHDNIGYVFCGSRKEILNEMVTKKSRAFFCIGPVIHLNKIDANKWIKYISKIYSENKFKLEEKTVETIVKRAENIPYYIQFLAHELWDRHYNTKIIAEKDVEETLKYIVKRNLPAFEMIWENLTGVQQKMLRGIVISDIENIFSNNFIQRYQIASRAAAEKAIKLLIKKDIIEKYESKYIISDLWFGEWIRYYIINI